MSIRLGDPGPRDPGADPAILARLPGAGPAASALRASARTRGPGPGLVHYGLGSAPAGSEAGWGP